MRCPCHSGSSYDRCCGPFINHREQAKTAEALMRSRYSAYVIKDYRYIWATYDKVSRAQLTETEIEDHARDTCWLGLKVEHTHQQHEHAEVTFCAYFKTNGSVHKHHERSFFVREHEHWKYLSGELLDDCGPVKVPRNQPCICGSGKKFKHCCGA